MTNTTVNPVKRPKKAKFPCTKYQDCLIHFDKGVANVISTLPKEVGRQEDPEGEWFNSYQYFLYRRCIFGLEVYSQEEIRYFPTGKKHRIESVYYRAQQVLNVFKQKLLINWTNRLILELFPMSDSAQTFVSSCSQIIPKYSCRKITFTDLGVTRKQIAGELVENKCLPKNFFSLTVQDDPRAQRLLAEQIPLDQL